MITTDRQERKDAPLATGLLDYFPLALIEIARLSKIGNDQHNPGEPLHWSRGKSNDHPDCIIRHLAERGKIDTDDVSHTVKVAWRSLALLQEEMEQRLAKETGRPPSDFSGLGSKWPEPVKPKIIKIPIPSSNGAWIEVIEGSPAHKAAMDRFFEVGYNG